MRKLILFKKIFVLIFLSIFGTFMAKSQTVTYLSGTGTNNANPAAGTLGSNSTYVGSGAAGYTGGGGERNTFLGDHSGFNTSSWDDNVGVGFKALYTLSGSASHDTTFNVAVGNYALYTNNPSTNPATDGIKNTAIGHQSLYSNATGNYNFAGGFQAGYSNTIGTKNTFTGYQAGYSNTTGDYNTFAGSLSGYSNTTGKKNAALGAGSLYSNVNGRNNTAVGFLSLTSINATSDSNNTAVGYRALYNANNTGGELTAVGAEALFNYSTGKTLCTAVGYRALFSCTVNGPNTAVGSNALYSNDGSYNVGMGSDAMYYNSSGNNNSVFGWSAGKGSTGNSYSDNSLFGYKSGYSITTGNYNTFFGSQSGQNNTTGTNNTFSGYQAGYSNIMGIENTFVGSKAGYSNTGQAFTDKGSYNTFIGNNSGINNVTGKSNSFLGYNSGVNTTSNNNTCIGYRAGYNNTTGTNNTCLGYGADVSAANLTNATAIGNGAIASSTYTFMCGNTSVPMVYSTNGFSSTSDGRFKFNVKENVKGLDFILKLRPVTYQLNTKTLDDFMIKNMSDSAKAMHQSGMNFAPSTTKVHSGFIAQEVEQASQQSDFISSIVTHPVDSNGVYAIRYEEIVVPLVKAIQEQQKMIDSLKTTVAALTSTNKSMQMPNNDGRGYTDANTQQVDLTNNDVILYQNIPNPFGSETTINYYLPETVNNAKMVFYDETGKVIKETELSEKGNGSIMVNSANLRSGIYSYSLVVNEKVMDTKRMQRLK